MNQPPPASVLTRLQDEIHRFCLDRDWKQFHNPKDLAMSLVLEATEVLEHFQWKSPEEIAAHLAERKDEFASELADTLYWLLILSRDLEIDLLDALRAKMRENERKYPVAKAKGNHKKYTEFGEGA